MTFDEETENILDEYVEETTEARREHDLIFWEGCAVVAAPTGAPPEYITVVVDGVNDPNVHWRGTPPVPAVGDELLVWENPASHRREVVAASGAGGVSGGGSWCQHVVVAQCGGDFTTLGAAVAWINALPAGQVPAANRLYVVWVLAGNYAEAADVTVPQYVHVVGHGEGTEVEMGVFTLNLSSHSSLANLVVESSDPVDAVLANNATNVVLREVKVVQGAAATCFHFTGNTTVWCHDCIAQSTVANATGFYFEDPASGGMEDCRAESGNFVTAFRTDSTKAVQTRYCRFMAATNDVLTGAGSDWDHFACSFDPTQVTIGGTHRAEHTKRFNQTVIVAAQGGDFGRVSEAITWIGALPAGLAPADARRYGILVLSGNFAEAGNITVPQWVAVAGMGEGSRIEMGANTLNMSDDSALMDLTVTGTTGTTITINDADCELFNVHAISDGNICVDISGDSDCELRHVVAETTSGCQVGFHVTNDATPLLFDCEADDASGFTIAALFLVNADCTCTTRYCTFHGDLDVWTGAASTWRHHKCEYDANNSTIAGTETPLRDGAVEIASDAVRGHNSLFPDLGTTTAAQMWGHAYLAQHREIYPDTDGRGLFTRSVNRGGLAQYTDHFRSGVIPGGFAWQGAPFAGAPAALVYNGANDYLWTTANGAGVRHFMSTAIANNAAAWQNKFIQARIRTGLVTEIGVRVDDGTDVNWVETYMTGVLANATQRLDFEDSAAGVTASALIIPVDTFVVVHLFCYWDGANYTFLGYVVSEDGLAVNVTGFSTGVVGWCPAAGRVGIIVKEAGNYGAVDWFYEDFG